jgi:hypothetical protein
MFENKISSTARREETDANAEKVLKTLMCWIDTKCSRGGPLYISYEGLNMPPLRFHQSPPRTTP